MRGTISCPPRLLRDDYWETRQGIRQRHYSRPDSFHQYRVFGLTAYLPASALQYHA